MDELSKLNILIIRSMSIQDQKKFYYACRSKKFRNFLGDLGLIGLVDFFFNDKQIQSTVIKYIDRYLNSNKMSSQRFIKFSYTFSI